MSDRLEQALAHPIRARILARLDGERLASPSDLSRDLQLPLSHVSYHVRRLQLFGAIELAHLTPRRGAVEHHYRLADLPEAQELARRARVVIVDPSLS